MNINKLPVGCFMYENVVSSYHPMFLPLPVHGFYILSKHKPLNNRMDMWYIQEYTPKEVVEIVETHYKQIHELENALQIQLEMMQQMMKVFELLFLPKRVKDKVYLSDALKKELELAETLTNVL